jgi:hypothetical protein
MEDIYTQLLFADDYKYNDSEYTFIIKTIKISKLRWTGLIMRMPEENPVKKLTY